MAALLLVAGVGIGLAVMDELQTSRRQAAWLSRWAAELHYEVKPGPSPAIRFGGNGPFDMRLGYHQLPELMEQLKRQDYVVVEQARMSPKMMELIDRGLFAVYREKTQAGLVLHDCRGQTLFAARTPERRYERFEEVPPLLVDALLFIENRELLDPRAPSRNPAVDWARSGRAVADQLWRRVDDSHPAGGGSTLATQIEKYRHSPEGRTETAKEKLRQMASASLRAYLDGADTLPRRRQIVVDYLNTVPLAAQAGFGEVNGLGDGLWAWYGRDFDEVNGLLAAPIAADDPPLLPPQRRALAFRQALVPRQALAFKQSLSLMIAQRRPAYYLAQGDDSDAGELPLRQLTDSYLRTMADAGVIPAALRDAALPLALTLQAPPVTAGPGSFVERKAATALRGKLQGLLATPRAYDLDRFDLTVDSPIDGDVQRTATALLGSLTDARAAKAAGLYGFRLLAEGDDPSRISFSFTLFERGEHSNLLRVQADNVDQPFDINEGARLDLGSTAKLRTLITYLELVVQLHEQWLALSAVQLAALDISRHDAIGRWARDHLARAADKSLATMLEAAMQRSYSANPAEGFYTGGGLHYFENFEPADNHRTMNVREALTRSVNLVFIRLMRDVVLHVMARSDDERTALLDDPTNPRRREYLARFADKEGQVFLARFYRKYAGKSEQDAEALLLRGMRPTPVRLAAAFYGLEPDAEAEALQRFLAQHLPGADLSGASLQALRDGYAAGRWSLADRGYLAGLHPLELWLVGYLRHHPKATLSDAIAASREQRQEVYVWLFKTRHKGAQDARIRNLLEVDAFAEIHRMWQRLGYPFGALTPSYASAIGASGDRPAALAALMGIVVNRGLRLPVTHVASLQFARGTPYETRFEYQPRKVERVLDAAVADVVRRALVGVVEDGTAKRLKGALVRRDGSVVEIGGKTGTGDHRYDTYGRGGRLIASRIVDRSATLVFLIGDRYFGTMMAYAHEPYAANYKFTSAMPVQLLKALAPTLLPLLESGGGCSDANDARK